MNIYSEAKTYESYSSEVERMQKCIDELQQENQELKLELSGYRQAILKDKEMLGLKEENQKYKEVIDRIDKYIEKETRIYGLSMSIELRTHFDNILGILKEVE